MDKNLNVRPETIKLLEENMGQTSSGINHSKILYDSPPGVMGVKIKKNKWDLIKLKSFYTTKRTKQGQKTALRMGENNTNERTDKELISKIYKQLMKLNARNPIKNWDKKRNNISPKKACR